MRGLIDYWGEKFDWRAQEARLNAFPQYKVHLQDIDLHFLQVEGQGPNPCPLLLSHGWPGSVFEFLELIPRLTNPSQFGGDPADLFTVVAPSLPGYGLSFSAGQPRFGVEEIADCFASLMTDVSRPPALWRSGWRLGFIYHITTCLFVSQSAHWHSPQHDAIASRSQDGGRSNFRRAEIP